MAKPKVLFLYDMAEELVPHWHDGLWAALELLKEDFEIQLFNGSTTENPIDIKNYDFVLGWGAFGGAVDQLVQHQATNKFSPNTKYGLCIGGVTNAHGKENYDVLFYETEYYKNHIEDHKNIVHAFGVNTDIFRPMTDRNIVWDYMTVGAFAVWKRQLLLTRKDGNKLAVGQIQKGNMQESMEIIMFLLDRGVMVSGQVDPEMLCTLYNSSGTVYIPANIVGGGERAVLEARACDVTVEVEPDNPKLQELLTCPVWDHHYYAEQLKKGILSCL